MECVISNPEQELKVVLDKSQLLLGPRLGEDDRVRTMLAHAGLIIVLFCLPFVGCRPNPVKTGILREPTYSPAPEPIAKRGVAKQVDEATVEKIRADNKKAGSPSFTIIRGFYQLPEAFSKTRVQIVEGVTLGGSFSAIGAETHGHKSSAISPIPPSNLQSVAFEEAMNILLDAGVVLKEISMADAIKVMTSEQAAIKKNEFFIPGRTLPPGADAFVSIQRGKSDDRGDILAGRIITSDGRLLAFATEIDEGFGYSIRPLIIKLVGDALSRWPTK